MIWTHAIWCNLCVTTVSEWNGWIETHIYKKIFELKDVIPEFIKRNCCFLVRQGRYHDVSMCPKEMFAEAPSDTAVFTEVLRCFFFQTAILLKVWGDPRSSPVSAVCPPVVKPGNVMVWFWFQHQWSQNGWSRSLVEDLVRFGIWGWWLGGKCQIFSQNPSFWTLQNCPKKQKTLDETWSNVWSVDDHPPSRDPGWNSSTSFLPLGPGYVLHSD